LSEQFPLVVEDGVLEGVAGGFFAEVVDALVADGGVVQADLVAAERGVEEVVEREAEVETVEEGVQFAAGEQQAEVVERIVLLEEYFEDSLELGRGGLNLATLGVLHF
jgi:hypothetical protein